MFDLFGSILTAQVAPRGLWQTLSGKNGAVRKKRQRKKNERKALIEAQLRFSRMRMFS